MLANALASLVGKLAKTDDGATMFVQGGGLEAVLELMETSGADADQCMEVLEELYTSSENAALRKRLIDLQVANRITAALQGESESEAFAKAAMGLLQGLTRSCDAEELGLDADSLKILNDVVNKHRANPFVATEGEALMNSLSAALGQEGAEMIGSRFDMAIAAMESAGEIQECVTEDGNVYYFNSATQETTWEQPAEFGKMVSALEGVAQLASLHEGNIGAVDASSFKAAIKAMETHSKQAGNLTAITKVLAKLGTTTDNINQIAVAGGLAAIIAAMSNHPGEVELLLHCITLLNQLACHDYYKEMIAKAGGVDLIIAACKRHVEHQELVVQCETALANLSFNSLPNIDCITDKDGVGAVEKVMQQYPQETKVLELALKILSNLLWQHDENKIMVGQTCGDEIVNIIRVHFAEEAIVLAALRALGNLSFCDENIPFLVKEGATECIVKGMTQHPNNVAIVRMALDVVGNFAALSPDDDVEDDPNVTFVNERLYHDGGPAAVLEALRSNQEPSIVVSALDSLCNFANHEHTIERLVTKGLVELVVETMMANDWDEELIDATIRLVSKLTRSETCVDAFVKANGVQTLLSSMEAHQEQPELVAHAMLAIADLAVEPQGEAMSRVASLGGVKTTLNAFKENMDNLDCTTQVIDTLAVLSSNDTLSTQIAESGMHLIMQSADTFKDDPNFLTEVFKLLGHLAFVVGNLKIIVQYGGIALIVNSICTHPESRLLMMRSIQTLENIAMASDEHAQIVISEGGKECIVEVKSAYGDDEEICEKADAALISLTTVGMEALKFDAKRERKKAEQKKEVETKRAVSPFQGGTEGGGGGALCWGWEGFVGVSHLLASRIVPCATFVLFAHASGMLTAVYPTLFCDA